MGVCTRVCSLSVCTRVCSLSKIKKIYSKVVRVFTYSNKETEKQGDWTCMHEISKGSTQFMRCARTVGGNNGDNPQLKRKLTEKFRGNRSLQFLVQVTNHIMNRSISWFFFSIWRKSSTKESHASTRKRATRLLAMVYMLRLKTKTELQLTPALLTRRWSKTQQSKTEWKLHGPKLGFGEGKIKALYCCVCMVDDG